MARVGIVGLPNVGKTTLFNALTGLQAHTAPHPFSTVEPAVGVARVPDPMVDQLAAVEHPDKIVHATLDLLDLPAMARPGSSGLGARFLARLREEEAVAVVLRAFEDEGVPDDESGSDPAEQAEALLLELALADLEVFTRKAEKAVKEATADPAKRPAAAAVARGLGVLDQGKALRTESWDEQERAAFQDLAPLTLKPAVWVVNVGEDDSSAAEKVAAVAALVPAGDTVVAVSARIEEEASRLDPEDRAELLQGFGLGEGALARVVQRHLRRPQPGHLLHRRPQGGARSHRPPRGLRPGGRRQDPQRHGARLHPGRDRPGRRGGGRRGMGRSQGRRAGEGGGAGLRDRRGGRHGRPLLRVRRAMGRRI